MTEVAEMEVYRSSQARQPVEQYVPLMSGKKYSYAATQIANQKYDHFFATMEEDGVEFDLHVIEFIFNQLTIKAAMKLWGNETTIAAQKEM